MTPEQREAKRKRQREWYRAKYATDRKFRHKESDRKAAWLQTDEGKAKNAEATRRTRQAKIRDTSPPT